MKTKFFVFLAFACAQISIFAQRTVNLNDENFNFSIEKLTTVPEEFREAKAARFFALNPALQREGSVKIGDIVILDLFENQNFKAQISNISTDVNGNYTCALKLADYPTAFGFITTNKNGKSLFSVSIPELNQKFVSRSNINSQINYLIEINNDLEKKLVDDYKIIPSETPVNIDSTVVDIKKKVVSRAVNVVNCTRDPNLTGTDPAIINLMIVYTAAAASWAAQQEGGITNTMAGAMAQTAAVLANQGNGDAINLIHSQLVNYIEHSNDMNTDLNNLTGTSDGFIDEVHQLRKQYNADIVALFTVANDYGGLGWVLNNSVNGSYNYAFNVIRVQQASWTTTSIHEIGHNMGMLHNREDNSNNSPLYPYAFGWHWRGTDNIEYGSVMSYIGTETPYFSNPGKNDHGKATGNDSTNNAQVFRNTKHVVAFYSDKIANIPDAPTNIVVSNPTKNGATITWDSMPGATSYSLYFLYNGGWWGWSNLTDTTLILNDQTYFQPCTQQQIRISAKNNCGDVSPQSQISFITKCATKPTVVTLPANPITQTTATLNKNVTAGEETVLAQGFYYKKSKDATYTLSANDALSGLPLNTAYDFFAYAKTATYPIVSGDTLHFTTLCQNYNLSKDTTVCSGTNYTFPDGFKQIITAPLQHTSNLHSVAGCDSIIVTNIINVKSADLTVSITDNVLTANQAGATYQWYSGCVSINPPMTQIPGATERTFSPAANGFYSVAITYNGCVFFSECKQVITTSAEKTQANNISVFPNPVNYELKIANYEGNGKYSITDITGKQIVNGQWQNGQSINVSTLPRGIYILKIGELRAKFVKE